MAGLLTGNRRALHGKYSLNSEDGLVSFLEKHSSSTNKREHPVDAPALFSVYDQSSAGRLPV